MELVLAGAGNRCQLSSLSWDQVLPRAKYSVPGFSVNRTGPTDMYLAEATEGSLPGDWQPQAPLPTSTQVWDALAAGLLEPWRGSGAGTREYHLQATLPIRQVLARIMDLAEAQGLAVSVGYGGGALVTGSKPTVHLVEPQTLRVREVIGSGQTWVTATHTALLKAFGRAHAREVAAGRV